MIRRLAIALLLFCGLLVLHPASASAQQVRALGFDCKEAPTPDMPGQGLGGFFEKEPDPLPRQADPFAPEASTTIYEQYGFAGLRWSTYDLGCGPDAARSPDAVIGTAMSNWLLNVPISLTALTSSITEVAFAPAFLDVFDPAIRNVSTSLHYSLFRNWVPAVIALMGIALLLRARRAALATTAASIGWALIVVLVATALFRWPLAAGHFADETVTSTLGSVVGDVHGMGDETKPGIAVASSVHESILYTSWIAGTLGTTESRTARKYGPELFKSQALTWREAEIVQSDPERGKAIIEEKQERFKKLAAEIEEADPAAYEHLMGKRSDTRVGYALLSALGALLALPFLLVASLLLLGSFLVVRLAVMLFPAFATLGVFPAGRGVVVGVGRTVGAALINAVIFGIGAAVTIRVLGVILDPSSRLPAWLAFVLMPLFGFMMWVALRPFRRLTHMVGPNSDPFGNAAGSLGNGGRSAKRLVKRFATTAAASYTGNLAAAATVASAREEAETPDSPPDRAEARPAQFESVTRPAPAVPRAELPAADAPAEKPPSAPSPHPAGPSISSEHFGETPGLPEGAPPIPTSESAPPPPTEPEWYDGEEVYAIYRPTDDGWEDDVA